jgi:hypothetical protein
MPARQADKTHIDGAYGIDDLLPPGALVLRAGCEAQQHADNAADDE